MNKVLHGIEHGTWHMYKKKYTLNKRMCFRVVVRSKINTTDSLCDFLWKTINMEKALSEKHIILKNNSKTNCETPN